MSISQDRLEKALKFLAETDEKAAELDAREEEARKKRDAEELARKVEEQRIADEKLEAERKQAEEDRAERERLEEIQRQQLAREAREREAERQEALKPAKVKLMAWAEQIKTMEGPKGIRGKNQQKIVNDALRGLGEVGNEIHRAVKKL